MSCLKSRGTVPFVFHRPLCDLALNRPRRWFADLDGYIGVERIPLDLNQSVDERTDAVLLHRVLRVLYFIESNGRETK